LSRIDEIGITNWYNFTLW